MFSPEAMRLLMEMDAPQAQKIALLKALERDWQAFVPPAGKVGVNEETERKRNVSTYAERKRAKDRERQRIIREVARQSRDVAGGSRDIDGDSTATRAMSLVDRAISPPSRPLPPQTPPTPTHPPGDITTRARGDAGFARFWLAYPRKTAKGDARKAFDRALRKLANCEDPEGLLIGALERAKSAWGDAQFIPHPATWLNGERWDDEPTIEPPRKAHERPHPDPKFDARQANLARALAGADSAAGRTWKP